MHAACNQFYPVIYTAVSTGLRQAELLGLRWRDIDLDMLSISVSQVLYKRRGVCIFKEPKTSGSSRRVSMTPKLGGYWGAICGNISVSVRFCIWNSAASSAQTTSYSPTSMGSRLTLAL